MTLKHIKTVRKPNGLVFTYLALPGRRLVRLPELPHDDPEFLAAYAAAWKEAKPKGKPAAAGSIAAAITAYQASDLFLALRPSTRETRRRILSKIADKAGVAPFRMLRPAHIEADVASLGIHASRNRLKTWRALCAWARDAKLIDSDPAAQVRQRRAPASDGHLPWTREDLERFRDHWPLGSAERTAVEVLQWTAARASDAVRLGPGMIDRDGWLAFRQGKTGGDVAVPLERELPAFASDMQDDQAQLRAALAALPVRHMTWIVTSRGAARSIKAFTQWLSAAARKAGVQKTAHGLRKYRATELAEAGATAHQIMAWTGHESLSEAERYARKADKRRVLSGPKRERILETESDQFPKNAKK